MQRRFFIGSRQLLDVVIVSALALIVVSPLISLSPFVKNGTKPQRAKTSSRSFVSLFCRTMGWCVVGAML